MTVAPVAMTLRQGAHELGIELTPGQLGSMDQYLGLLAKWNRVYNLTSIRDQEKWVSHHVLDSLAVASHLHGNRMIDVGTGAGLPGIPLAITHPEQQFVLLDSNHKKSTFLRQVTVELRLTNVEVVIDRVENYQPQDKFDIVLSRAFSDLRSFVQTAGHLLRSGGHMAAMKGIYPHEELEQLPPEVKLSSVERLSVPGLAAERHLVLLEHSVIGVIT